jgi:hypothetical protein
MRYIVELVGPAIAKLVVEAGSEVEAKKAALRRWNEFVWSKPTIDEAEVTYIGEED